MLAPTTLGYYQDRAALTSMRTPRLLPPSPPAKKATT
jgi:hypothetical protein